MQKKNEIINMTNYFLFGCMMIIYYALAAFAWEYFLAILITSFIWVALWRFFNSKNIKKIVSLEEQNKSLTETLGLAKAKLESSEVIRGLMVQERSEMERELVKKIRELKLKISEIIEPKKKEFDAIHLVVPQSEACKRLGEKFEQEQEEQAASKV